MGKRSFPALKFTFMGRSYMCALHTNSNHPIIHLNYNLNSQTVK